MVAETLGEGFDCKAEPFVLSVGVLGIHFFETGK